MPEVTIVAHHVGGPGGGMERQLAALVTGLLQRGFGVTVVARRCAVAPHPRLRHVRVRVPRARPFALAFLWFMAAATVATARHRRGALHTTGAIVLNRADVSTVHFCHHAFNGARDDLPLWRRLAAAAERVVYLRRTHRLVTVSEGLAGELRAAYGDLRISIVPNGVDTARFRPDPDARRRFRAEHGIPEDALVAAFVGGEWERKGLRHAIDAVERTDRWRLVVAGKGQPPRPSHRVAYLGVVTDPEALLAAADAFVFPSEYEAMPLAVNEAAASGLPLLVGRVSGVEAVLRDGETGWVVEREGAAIARRLRELEDAEHRARLGAAARQRAAALDWEQVVDAYVALYAGRSCSAPRS